MRVFGLLLVLLVVGSSPLAAREIRLTIYDDGLSCPSKCDAHVVLNPADNGTRYASLPTSARDTPLRCTVGAACRICFGEADNTCMTVTYRGGGPPVGTFDFTPAFYRAHCGDHGVPSALESQCAALDAVVVRLAYDKRINCFRDLHNPLCASIMQSAAAARAADVPKRARCLELGQAAYNSQVAPAERRANECNYSEARLGGPNAKGVRWRLLLSGACRPGTYVGRDGLDCCQEDERFSASVHPECAAFFPRGQ
jgi:hypothetical protein